LAERAAIQAAKFGAQLTVPGTARAFRRRDGYYQVTLDDGGTVSGRTVVIATGARYRKLNVPRLEEFESKSVYYAATLVEALNCRGDPVAVVGGGNSAGQASLFQARYTARMHLLVRAGDLGKDMSRYLVDQIERHPSVQVLCNTEVRELVGKSVLESLVVENNRTGERTTLPAQALFVFIGAAPAAGWLGDELALDERLGADRPRGRAAVERRRDRRPA
jgi:thioredoxin reductase (NADPH)